ncbi:MAG: esterase-like activity of phytase family protein [Pseudomonadota bacterium]
MRNVSVVGLATLCLTACAGSETSEPSDPGVAWRFLEQAAPLRAASCRDGVPFERPSPITLTAEAIELGDDAYVANALPGLDYVAGYVLTSDEDAFGGLSGLDAFPSGNLLAVTDKAAFVWISLEEGDGFVPLETGYFAPMRDGYGAVITGKADGDSEGLALQEGLAIVSFERNHRIAAFDLEGCGINARAAPVAAISGTGSGLTRALPENAGAEGLALAGDALVAGIEEDMDGAPAGLVMTNSVDFSLRLGAPTGLSLTGFDILDGTMYSVHRLYSPGVGNRIAIMSRAATVSGETLEIGAPNLLGLLTPDGVVDNFEAIAALPRPDGGVRLVIASDDNFSSRQRTLLMAFDVATD